MFQLDFNEGNYTTEGGLQAKLDAMLCEVEGEWGDEWAERPYGIRFGRLLRVAHERTGHRVAILNDEYDKPLLGSVHDPALEGRNRAALKAFFSTLKRSDEHLRFVLVTGVTKFSKVSTSFEFTTCG